MLDLKGIIPPLVTPFDENGAIRYDYFERNLDRYLEAGIEGYLVIGSNGESVYLEHSEKLKLIETARKRLPSSVTLLAGTGVESTRATLELTKEAADCGVDAVLVKNPFYFKNQMTFDVYIAHYTAVADASPVPVVIYNVPAFTGLSLDSPLVVELAKHPNLRGMKDSSGNVKLISEVVWNTDPQKFSVLAGAAPTLFSTMVVGARGGIVALACAAPRAMMSLYRAVIAGDYKKAGMIQRIIAPAAGAVTEKYGIAGLKGAMELEGFQPGLPRLPLLPLKQAQRQDLEQVLRRMNSELAELS
ncbi:MAG: dihydrodipicolinate synthase family protein [Acidobacteria bacterium]|nr:MAG: dihydrodipicolinate synthase family protein [Acidobacteriota bacterium]